MTGSTLVTETMTVVIAIAAVASVIVTEDVIRKSLSQRSLRTMSFCQLLES
jgi:hypothetical protein